MNVIEKKSLDSDHQVKKKLIPKIHIRRSISRNKLFFEFVNLLFWSKLETPAVDKKPVIGIEFNRLKALNTNNKQAGNMFPHHNL